MLPYSGSSRPASFFFASSQDVRKKNLQDASEIIKSITIFHHHSMQRVNFRKIFVAILGLIIPLVLIIFFSDMVLFLKSIIEQYISPDHHVEPNKIYLIKTIIAIFILLIIALCAFSFFNIWRKILAFIRKWFNTGKAGDFFLRDEMCSRNRLSIYLLVIGTLLGFLLHINYLLFGKPVHEGAIEVFGTLLFLLSGIILIIAATRIGKVFVGHRTKTRILITLIALSAVMLLIFGEEISWGQRIIGWESSGIFNEYNLQHETNIHNFFNPMVKFIYPVIGMGTFIVLFFLWLFLETKGNYLLHLLIPHPGLFFPAFIMACSSFRGHSEIFEALLAIFIFLYSFRIFMCLNCPGKNYQSNLSPESQA